MRPFKLEFEWHTKNKGGDRKKMQKEIITGFVILLTLTMITIPVYGVRTWEEIYKEKSTQELYKEKESIQKDIKELEEGNRVFEEGLIGEEIYPGFKQETRQYLEENKILIGELSEQLRVLEAEILTR